MPSKFTILILKTFWSPEIIEETITETIEICLNSLFKDANDLVIELV
jgi:hypothetical protein